MSRIMICLGGSATNDGGIGIADGFRCINFSDCHHQPVIPTMKGFEKILNILIGVVWISD